MKTWRDDEILVQQKSGDSRELESDVWKAIFKHFCPPPAGGAVSHGGTANRRVLT